MNSTPSLLQKKVTRDLLILGAEPRALGQSGRLRLSHEGLELRHLQGPKWGVLSTEDSSPLGCWGGDGAGWAGSICCVAISSDFSVVTLGGGSERVLLCFK